ncbi:MAG: tRNA pseudouridine(13) synthase TruD [Gammaproteobacteria bacterium]|nr:MAG: tRNA pseudouridine(13) synthase TruD [Gammaproteobacteria bacterium]
MPSPCWSLCVSKSLAEVQRLSPFSSFRFPAIWRAEPAHFKVTELLDAIPEGAGEHWWVWVEKSGQNTDWVARQLQQALGIPSTALGYAGLKDRHAITGQWFSVQLPGQSTQPEWPAIEGVHWGPSIRCLKKLRRGDHEGNRFSITLLFPGEAPARLVMEELLTRIRQEGFPNYFGEQRFGRDGQNLTRALDWMEGRWRPKGRHLKSLMLSALRSHLFNAVLASRVRDNTWSCVLEGERPEGYPGDEPLGPLFGGQLPRAGEAGVYDENVYDTCSHVCAFLHKQGLRPAWRPLIARVPDLSWHWLDGGIRLDFSLAAGGFASVLLEMLFELQQPEHTNHHETARIQ